MRSFAFYVHDFHFGRRGDNLNFVVLVVIGNIVFAIIFIAAPTQRENIFSKSVLVSDFHDAHNPLTQ